MAERWPVNKQTVNNSQIIVGLEIGTSKVCVAVGEVSENQVVNIIGLGQAQHRPPHGYRVPGGADRRSGRVGVGDGVRWRRRS